MELTREMIMKMDMGKEMDMLIAERVMKWKRDGECWIDDLGDTRTIESTSFGHFRPSTRIESAWEVMEHPYIMDKVQLGIYPTSFGLWFCRSYMPGWDIQVQSITAADAISRAALLTTIKE